MKNKKQAFSFVEIIIVISILTLLTIIWVSSKMSYDEKVNNSKIIADIQTINNALESYNQETSKLPMPEWNTNFFKADSSYAHSYDQAFWVYGNLTENTLSKKYIETTPLDPRTNSYYSYWKTKDSNEFEIASVQKDNWEYKAKVIWNYIAESGPYNLIRSYNSQNFVSDDSFYLPYNPEELILVATDSFWNIYREWDAITTWTAETKEIFFSDWSVSIIEENSSLTLNKLNFPEWDNLNTIIKLALWAGTIWTKATSLNENSEFEVYTTDSTAAVRWTIFWVTKNSSTEITVVEWEVEVYNTDEYNLENNLLEKWELITSEWELKVQYWESPKTKIINNWDSSSSLNNDSVNQESILEKFSDAIEDEFAGQIDSSALNKMEESWKLDNTDSYNNSEIVWDNQDSEPLVDTNIECKSFEIDWVCQDDFADESLTNSWFTLVWFAPFEDNVTLYWTWTTTVENLRSCSENWLTFSETTYSSDKWTICEKNWVNGIFVDWDWSDDLYKISNLDLSWNFAIEMRVRWDAFTGSLSKFLFQDKYWVDDSNIELKYMHISKKLVFGINWNYDTEIDVPSSINTNNFYTIIAKKTSTEISLEIKDLGINKTVDYELTVNIWNELYIGSNNDKSNQINTILDYIKIYK